MAGLPAEHVFRGLEELVAIPAYHVDPTSREPEEITEKFTGKVIGSVPRGTEEDTLEAIARARKAQKYWEDKTFEERAAILKKFHRLNLKEREATLDILQGETGKCRASAQEEVLDASMSARYYARVAKKLLAPDRVKGVMPFLTKTTVNRRAKGVVGIIAPWNYPYTLAASDAIPALMAGNAVVLKPDSQTPYSALRAAQLMYEAGVPRDVFQVVTGPGRAVGSTLADNADYLMFTGSSRTGKALGEQTGKRLIGYSAELGGKNAMIIENGANIKKCVNVCMRAMYANSGQLCISIERVYIDKRVYQEFLDALKERLDRLVISADYEWETEYGSIISEKQIQTIESHIQDAVSKGATIFYGGKRLPEKGPLFFAPTVLINVPPEAEVWGHETFGPLVSIYPVDSMEEAIERANDTEYGLNSSVFGRTYASGEKIGEQLHTGTVSVSEGYAPGWGSIRAPMGGQGISGVSHRHGPEGILKYTESSTVAVQRLITLDGPGFIPHAMWQKLLPMISWIITA